MSVASEAPAPLLPFVISRRHVAASVAGNALEFYDFVTYAYFAVQIGQAFFPAHTAFGKLMLSLAVFGVGFVSRPIGAIVIGAYGDRAGRRPAMLLSFGLMGAGVLGLALTPTYAAIGALAPVLVVLSRLVQGFALGGEVGPTTSFLVEAAPPGRRGLYGAWQIASQHMAQIVAGAVGISLSMLMSPADLDAWGWRIPFLLGAAILPFGLWARHGLPETHPKGPGDAVRADPRRYVALRSHRRAIACGLGLITAGTIATYVLIYMTTYAKTVLHMTTGGALTVPLVSGSVSMACGLAGAALSDRVGRRRVTLSALVGALVCAYPVFLLISSQRSVPALLGGVAVLAVFSSAALSVSVVWIAEAFPKAVRSATMAAIYATAVATFGGTAQLVMTWLIHLAGALAPAVFLGAAMLVGMVAAALMPGSDHAGSVDQQPAAALA